MGVGWDERRPGSRVWAFPLDAAPAEVDRLAGWLTPEERGRAARRLDAAARARAVVARGRLREVLGSYLDAAPGALRFTTGPAGKPALVDADGLEFNLSHGGGIGLVATSVHAPVGVDVEPVRVPGELDGLVERCLTAAERDDLGVAGEQHGAGEVGLAGDPREARARGFLRLWARKESFVKARGDGLGLDLARVDAAGGGDGGPLRLDGTPVPSGCWDLPVAVDHAAAVTVLADGVGAPTLAWWVPPQSEPVR